MTIVAWDRPAFGYTERKLPPKKSQRSPTDLDYYSQEFACDVGIELLQKLGFTQAILVGHSAGGLLSMFTYLRRADAVKALVLLDTPLVQRT